MDLASVQQLAQMSQPLPAVDPSGKTGGAASPEFKAATEQFEAVFLRQFLGQALKPLLHDTPGSQASGSGIYQYMLTDAIANSISESGQFGFSSLLQMQLAEHPSAASPGEAPSAGSSKPTEERKP